MNLQAFGETFVTLLVVMDPVGNAPVFVSLTRHMPSSQARAAAVSAVGAAALLVLGFAAFGRFVLDYLHVSLASLSVAGGLLLILVALEMLRGQDMPTGATRRDIALVPLATPLLAGPGAIATVMVLVRRHPGTAGEVGVYAGIASVIVVVGLTLLAAERVSRAVPEAVLRFLTQVFGLLLSAIAIQLIADGARSMVGS